jgi:ABC-2 type transport system permease protein
MIAPDPAVGGQPATPPADSGEATTPRADPVPIAAKPAADGQPATPRGKRATQSGIAVVERPAPRQTRWGVIAAKEFADNLLSVRFFVLLVILGLAAVAAVSTAASAIKDAASGASGTPSAFLLLFTAAPGDIPSFVSLVGFLGPLLGIAFAFDAITGERSQRTLPRLVSQPVHRDDVINGKFVAGLAAVAVSVIAVMLVVAGVGILRLGIVPEPDDIARLLVYVVLTVIYIGLWMAFALLCSVTLRRAATSALVAIAVWLILALFGLLLAGLLADLIAPVDAAGTAASQVHHMQMQNTLSLISPLELYQQATGALLNPQVRAVGVVLPQQTDQAVAGPLSFVQSMLVVWPQIVALIAASVVVFAIAYMVFLRQEVRA